MPSAFEPVPSIAILPRSRRAIQLWDPPPFIHRKMGPFMFAMVSYDPCQTGPLLLVPMRSM